MQTTLPNATTLKMDGVVRIDNILTPQFLSAVDGEMDDFLDKMARVDTGDQNFSVKRSFAKFGCHSAAYDPHETLNLPTRFKRNFCGYKNTVPEALVATGQPDTAFANAAWMLRLNNRILDVNKHFYKLPIGELFCMPEQLNYLTNVWGPQEDEDRSFELAQPFRIRDENPSFKRMFETWVSREPKPDDVVYKCIFVFDDASTVDMEFQYLKNSHLEQTHGKILEMLNPKSPSSSFNYLSQTVPARVIQQITNSGMNVHTASIALKANSLLIFDARLIYAIRRKKPNGIGERDVRNLPFICRFAHITYLPKPLLERYSVNFDYIKKLMTKKRTFQCALPLTTHLEPTLRVLSDSPADNNNILKELMPNTVFHDSLRNLFNSLFMQYTTVPIVNAVRDEVVLNFFRGLKTAQAQR